jgi:hypothetical protein
MGQWKSEGQDFKERLQRTWDSTSLRTETLKGNMGQCTSEGQDFKRHERKHGTV